MPTRRKPRKARRVSRVGPQRRGLQAPRGLGQQLLDTIEQLIELMEHTRDADRLKELNCERVALSNEARRLIEAAIDASSAEYQAATAALKEASDTIGEAIRGLESIKQAILAAAKAAALVGKVAVA